VIHATPLDADHVQSRFVVIVSVPLPPLDGAEVIEAAAPTWHFVPVGAVTDVDVDPHPHPATTNARTQAHRNG
jgi:hypothetical protein